GRSAGPAREPIWCSPPTRCCARWRRSTPPTTARRSSCATSSPPGTRSWNWTASTCAARAAERARSWRTTPHPGSGRGVLRARSVAALGQVELHVAVLLARPDHRFLLRIAAAVAGAVGLPRHPRPLFAADPAVGEVQRAAGLVLAHRRAPGKGQQGGGKGERSNADGHGRILMGDRHCFTRCRHPARPAGSQGAAGCIAVAQRLDQATRTLVRALLRRPVAVAHRRPLLALLLAGLPGGLALRIQRLCHRRRPARIAEPEHLDLESLLAAAHPQPFTHPDRARRLRTLPDHFDLAGLHRLLGEAAGAEEARGPQPHVHANR